MNTIGENKQIYLDGEDITSQLNAVGSTQLYF
jgi:hypothetical protein